MEGENMNGHPAYEQVLKDKNHWHTEYLRLRNERDDELTRLREENAILNDALDKQCESTSHYYAEWDIGKGELTRLRQLLTEAQEELQTYRGYIKFELWRQSLEDTDPHKSARYMNEKAALEEVEATLIKIQEVGQ
jgi:hypothetical protein